MGERRSRKPAQPLTTNTPNPRSPPPNPSHFNRWDGGPLGETGPDARRGRAETCSAPGDFATGCSFGREDLACESQRFPGFCACPRPTPLHRSPPARAGGTAGRWARPAPMTEPALTTNPPNPRSQPTDFPNRQADLPNRQADLRNPCVDSEIPAGPVRHQGSFGGVPRDGRFLPPRISLQTRWPAAGHPQSPRLAPGGFYGEGTGSERSEVPVPVSSTRRAASEVGAAAQFAPRAVSVSLKIRSNSARVRAVTACTSLTSSAGRS